MRIRLFLGTLLLFFVGAMQLAQAVELSRVPLVVSSRVDPNLMFIIDDSGSMQFENMPESNIAESARYIYPRTSGIYGSGSYSNIVPTFDEDDPYNAYSRSPQVNALYYNPAVTYRPWVRADGTRMAAANPTNAFHNPSRTNRGGRNLTFENTQSAERWIGDCRNITEDGPEGCEAIRSREYVCGWFGFFYRCGYQYTDSYEDTFYPAFYYSYTGGSYNNINNYRRVEIRFGNGPFKGEGRGNRSDCANASADTPSCTYAEEIQNFANWYSYYRSRTLAARGGTGEAFSQLGEAVRVGFDTINSDDSGTNGEVSQGVRVFKEEGRRRFFDELYDHDVPTDGTPLRRALQRSGSYFEKKDEPWRNDPTSDQDQGFQSCRANYALMMTDGYWSGDEPQGINNADGTRGEKIEGTNGLSYQYPGDGSYADDVSSTLGDVAMYFWKRDIRPNLANDLAINTFDPAFWQHMTTYGVGLGVSGSLDPESTRQAIENGEDVDWPSSNDLFGRFTDTDTKNRARLDDLLHASFNGHGAFLSASNPEAFAAGLESVLGSIVTRGDSSVVPAVVTNDTIGPDEQLFEAGFRSIGWSGKLKSYPLILSNDQEDGEDDTEREANWDAEVTLREQATDKRLLLTSRGGNGQILSTNSSDLSEEQVSWLYGKEVDGLRSRIPEGQEEPNLLGDIANSIPYLLKAPDNSDSGNSGSDANKRPDMLFVGANDGMLHGFSAESGKELFAYLPSELVTNQPGGEAPIESLMARDYVHRYFVDGSPVARSVEIEGGPDAVVVGTMGAGGRTVFALDVSDPEGMSTDDVLWEFSDAALGEGVTRPSISRVRYQGQSRWVALFGNAYNSEAEQAVMFVVDLQTGQLLKRWNTGIGGANNSNGLAPPTATRWPDYNGFSQYAYAGDLLGNMWRFDLSDLSSTPQRLLEGQVDQPITAPPQLEFRPGDSSTLVVLFGTGSFQFVGDRYDNSAQRLYGLFDNGNVNAIDAENPGLQHTKLGIDNDTGYRFIEGASGSPERGWYMDLPDGERLVSKPTLPAGIYHQRALFSTLKPVVGQCTAKINGYVYSLLLNTGGVGTRPFFDTNGDNKVDNADKVTDSDGNAKVVAGIRLGNGESQVVVRDPETGQGVLAGTIGNDDPQRTGISAARTGRQSWRQVFEP